MVEEWWWPLGLQRTAAASSARQRLVGAGHRRGRQRLRGGLRIGFFLGSSGVAWGFFYGVEFELHNCVDVPIQPVV